MTVTIKSEKTATIKVMDSLNGMNIIISQKPRYVEMSIDQAATLAVSILNHVQEMQKKHLS